MNCCEEEMQYHYTLDKEKMRMRYQYVCIKCKREVWRDEITVGRKD